MCNYKWTFPLITAHLTPSAYTTDTSQRWKCLLLLLYLVTFTLSPLLQQLQFQIRSSSAVQLLWSIFLFVLFFYPANLAQALNFNLQSFLLPKILSTINLEVTNKQWFYISHNITCGSLKGKRQLNMDTILRGFIRLVHTISGWVVSQPPAWITARKSSYSGHKAAKLSARGFPWVTVHSWRPRSCLPCYGCSITIVKGWKFYNLMSLKNGNN